MARHRHESRHTMGRGCRERSDSFARQCARACERQVTGGARGVRHSEMRFASASVARHALGRARRTNLHPARSRISMTISTGRGIAALVATRGVPDVIKLQIRNPRCRARLPRDALRGRAVMTCVAGAGNRKLRGTGTLDPGVTSDTTDKYLGMCGVWKRRGLLGRKGTRCDRNGDCNHPRESKPRGHGPDAGGRAGGSHRSADDRSVSEARALRRHWFQSMLAASGRSRASQ